MPYLTSYSIAYGLQKAVYWVGRELANKLRVGCAFRGCKAWRGHTTRLQNSQY